MNIIDIYKKSFKDIDGHILNFALMMLVNRLGTLILPFLTLYTTQHLGWSKIDAGTATMWFGIGSFVGAWLGGILSDKFGYYKVMVFSLFSAAIFFFILQYFTDLYMLCGFLFISNVLADLLRPALYSGLTHFTNPTNRTRAVSLLRMAFNLGISIGPVIAGVFIVRYGYHVIFYMEFITCFLAGIYLLKNMEDRSEIQLKDNKITNTDTSNLNPWKDYPYLIFMASCILMLISFFQILFTVPLFLKEEFNFTETQIGIFYYGVNGMIIFIFEMPLVHYIENKMENFSAMILGSTMIGLAILFLIFPLSGIALLVLYMIFVSFGEIINFPFISSATMARAPQEVIGKYMGINTMMFSVALILAPKIGTWILEIYGYNILFIFMFVICIISNIGVRWAGHKFDSEQITA